ncbi:hypothetical protein SLS60_004101 [Paraconiothyrium brasiliense]|uniref:cutinase n=1 Tax=Paraconiothyrium brasiliense TaxID=300254 RepID=A0ABR3RQI9_9PLEO
MHTQSFLTLALITLAAATPMEKRATGSTSNEFTQGGCRDVMFAFARGSTEIGNMGTICGPQTSDGLKAALGDANVATEGINYAAALAPNAMPGGTDAKSKQAMADILNQMVSQCPDSVILAGGYSQGAAVSHRAIESLDPAVQNQIAGVILYGDTQNTQDNGQIPNFDPAKTKIICANGDLVCDGTLTILPPHLSYGRNAADGAAFLVQKAQTAMAAKKAKRAETEAKREVGDLAKKMAKIAVNMVA